jgi:NAD+ kinase
LKKSADKIRRVGLIGNPEKADCGAIVRKAARLVERVGRAVFSDAQTARLAGIKRNVRRDEKSLAGDVDLLLVFGGDGTILGVAREIAGINTPMLGVNIGGLGFLTGVPSDKLAAALKLVWRGEFNYESRALIEVSGRCHGRPIRETALNDIVVSRGAVSRLIALDVSVDHEPITRYHCDGLIVSSPTGSTAYSLSSGGPIVLPTAEVFCLTPISPHSLSNRSIILPLSSAIRIKATNPLPATLLSADGRAVAELDAGDEVTIRRSRRSVRLIQLAQGSFLGALRRKLHWRGTYL